MANKIRWYTVTQTRKVRVEAQDPLSAAHIAQLAFDGRAEGPDQASMPPVLATLRETDLEVREDFI